MEIAKLEKAEDIVKVYEKVKSEDLSRKEIRELKKELKTDDQEKEGEGDQKDTIKDESSKDAVALINHADKLIGILWKLKESISDEAKAKLVDLVKEINKVVNEKELPVYYV